MYLMRTQGRFMSILKLKGVFLSFNKNYSMEMELLMKLECPSL